MVQRRSIEARRRHSTPLITLSLRVVSERQQTQSSTRSSQSLVEPLTNLTSVVRSMATQRRFYLQKQAIIIAYQLIRETTTSQRTLSTQWIPYAWIIMHFLQRPLSLSITIQKYRTAVPEARRVSKLPFQAMNNFMTPRSDCPQSKTDRRLIPPMPGSLHWRIWSSGCRRSKIVSKMRTPGIKSTCNNQLFNLMKTSSFKAVRSEPNASACRTRVSKTAHWWELITSWRPNFHTRRKRWSSILLWKKYAIGRTIQGPLICSNHESSAPGTNKSNRSSKAISRPLT